MQRQVTSVVGITQGANQPSTRFRWNQYVSYLQQKEFEVKELPSRFSSYPPISRVGRPVWLVGNIIENGVRACRANRCDIRFLQRNMAATLCTWEPLLARPLIFDVDDAIFLGPRGESANKIAKRASLVICGNSFLANHFDKYAAVAVLPTAVDTNRFCPRYEPRHRQVIGWSGSSSGLKYLYAIEDAIARILDVHLDSVLKVVSDSPPRFEKLPSHRVVFERWAANREAEVLREFSVGLMPLEDDLWARGKCSYKMLTYMASGIPVVVSPVGMNVEVLKSGKCGLAAGTKKEWFDAISCLLSNSTLAGEMGGVGRAIVESNYSVSVIAPQLELLLRSQL